MNVVGMIVLASLVASFGVVVVTAIFVIYGSGRDTLRSWILSFAVGTLLASSFLGLLPTALAHGDAVHIFETTLAGIVLFFVLEKCLIFRHCHRPQCPQHSASGALIVIGDAFHNFVDGLVIAVGFLSSVPIGLSVTLAVIAHEVPQEVGDFAILLHSGYTARRAFLLNSLSAMTTPVGAVLACVTFSQLQPLVPYALALSAASFLYVGTTDLIPGLQRETSSKAMIAQLASVLAGIFVIAGLRIFSVPE